MKWFPDGFCDFLRHCWHEDPASVAIVGELLNHVVSTLDCWSQFSIVTAMRCLEGGGVMGRVFYCIVLLMLSGCGAYTPRQVAEPTAISLKQAVFEVADSLYEVQGRVPLEKRSGLIADEVTVVFNVAASSTTTSSAGLTVSNVALAGVGGTLGANGQTENVSLGSRGNTVTIKFKNVATADMSKSSFKSKRICSDNEKVGPCTRISFDQE